MIVWQDNTCNIREKEWKAWNQPRQLKSLESLIGFKIINGDSLNLSWNEGCPKSTYISSSDSNLDNDPYIEVSSDIIKEMRFKTSGSSTLYQTIIPTTINEKIVFLLTGVLFWGEISLEIDTANLYKWVNQTDELSTGLGVMLDNTATTKRIDSLNDKDIYLINTQNFKIQDKKICVYGSEGINNEQNNGNYTYNYDFNYGYDIGRNYYAWGKTKVSSILLYSNADSQETPIVTVKPNKIIINNKSYAKPSNAKILVCRRSGINVVGQDIQYLDSNVLPRYEISAAPLLSTDTTAILHLYKDDKKDIPNYSWSFGKYAFKQTYYTAEINTEGIYNLANESYYTEDKNARGWNKLGFKLEQFEQVEYIMKRQDNSSQASGDWLRGSYSRVFIPKYGDYVPGSFNFEAFNIYNHSSTPISKEKLFQIKENPQVCSFADKDNKTMFAYAGYSLNVSASVPGIIPKTILPLIENPNSGQVSINGNTYPYYKADTNSGSEWNYQAYAYAATEFNGTADAFWIFMVPKDFSLS